METAVSTAELTKPSFDQQFSSPEKIRVGKSFFDSFDVTPPHMRDIVPVLIAPGWG